MARCQAGGRGNRSKKLFRTPGFQQRCWLVKNGVPYTVAMEEMSDAEVMAHSIAFSEMEGYRFNWKSMTMEQPNA